MTDYKKIREEMHERFSKTFEKLHMSEKNDEIALLRAEIKRLRTALEPFSALAKYYDPEEDDEADQIVWYEAGKPTIGDLRRARAALKEKTAADYDISLENPAIALTQETRT